MSVEQELEETKKKLEQCEKRRKGMRSKAVLAALEIIMEEIDYSGNTDTDQSTITFTTPDESFEITFKRKKTEG
ncbi:hypothetical protein [Paraflavitalea pollutisoli]|uniref:hypothetical protein n=1 Tax=Paraflavitalea pollutisoli TaxID=3034143 RepID=UPI0023EDF356|nr:hypothetical protein [Paraflavitalea sp. H1-2-19X]